MRVKEAKAIARQWVEEEGTKIPGFYGAFFLGSINWKADDEPLPITSDVDVKLVISGEERPTTFIKTLYRNVLLEVSAISSDDIQSAEQVLSNYAYARHFTTPNVIADPSGHLAAIKAVVKREYTRREWVRRRCDDAFNWLETTLGWLKAEEPLHEQVFCWVYPFAITSHVLLIPALRDPTVRQALAIAAEVLAEYGDPDVHEQLLTNLGSLSMPRDVVHTLLSECIAAVDRVRPYFSTYFFGSANLESHSRPIIVEGTQEMIDRGYHREAMWWIAWNYQVVQTAAYNDAPADIRSQTDADFRRFLSALGIQSEVDLQQRHAGVRELVPRLREVADAILAANPAVED